jgi:hypothetical protein
MVRSEGDDGAVFERLYPRTKPATPEYVDPECTFKPNIVTSPRQGGILER